MSDRSTSFSEIAMENPEEDLFMWLWHDLAGNNLIDSIKWLIRADWGKL
jgi:hypothetical protein